MTLPNQARIDKALADYAATSERVDREMLAAQRDQLVRTLTTMRDNVALHECSPAVIADAILAEFSLTPRAAEVAP